MDEEQTTTNNNKEQNTDQGTEPKPAADSHPAWLDELCPITLIPFREIPLNEILLLPCFHRFHKPAIVTHLRTGHTFCPVCKVMVNPAMFDIVVDQQSRRDDSEEPWESIGSEEERSPEDSPTSLDGFIVDDSDEPDDDEDYHPEGEEEEEEESTDEEAEMLQE